MGWLDDEDETASLQQGTVVDLPMYIAADLIRLRHVIPRMPSAYTDRARKNLKADPEVVNLIERNPYFYLHGLAVHAAALESVEERMLSPEKDEELRDLLGVLARSFLIRYRRILDTCLTGADGDPRGLTQRLACTESRSAARSAGGATGARPSPYACSAPGSTQSSAQGWRPPTTTTTGRRKNRGASRPARPSSSPGSGPAPLPTRQGNTTKKKVHRPLMLRSSSPSKEVCDTSDRCLEPHGRARAETTPGVVHKLPFFCPCGSEQPRWLWDE